MNPNIFFPMQRIPYPIFSQCPIPDICFCYGQLRLV